MINVIKITRWLFNRYSGGSPAEASAADFPVTPGGAMPSVPGCQKQDYWVVFVVGIDQAE